MKKNIEEFLKRIKTIGRIIKRKLEADEMFVEAMDGDRLVSVD